MVAWLRGHSIAKREHPRMISQHQRQQGGSVEGGAQNAIDAERGHRICSKDAREGVSGFGTASIRSCFRTAVVWVGQYERGPFCICRLAEARSVQQSRT